MHCSFFSGRVVLFEKEDFNIREDAATVELLAGAGSFAVVDTGYLTLAYQSYQQFFWVQGSLNVNPILGGGSKQCKFANMYGVVLEGFA